MKLATILALTASATAISSPSQKNLLAQTLGYENLYIDVKRLLQIAGQDVDGTGMRYENAADADAFKRTVW